MSKTKEIRKTDMIKTLRITSIIAAVLAAGLFVFPAIFGLRSNQDTKKFLSLPSVVEEFRKAKGDRDKGGEGQISPLVKQAQAFGLYLNPPKPVKQTTRTTARKPDKGDIVPPPSPRPLTPKFKVIAISFYASHPESSLVLIDEPGKGRHWVRESTVVSHLTIEQIKDGLVVVKGAKGTFELAPESRPLQRSLVAGSSPVSLEMGGQTRPKFTSALGPSEAESVTDASDGTSELEQMSPEEQAAFAERIFAELAAMGTGEGPIEPDKTDSEPGAGVEKPVSDFEDMRISGKEAKKLGHLGQELKGGPGGVEQDPNRPKSRKTEEAARESWKRRKPKTPAKSSTKTTSRPRREQTKKKPTSN